MKLLVSRGDVSILVVCDRFLRISHFIAIIEKITVEELARVFSRVNKGIEQDIGNETINSFPSTDR